MTAASAPPARLGHRPALDGLRGVAVLAVVVHHVGALLLPAWGRHLLPAGFLGVDVFFVLSGFLITTLLVERRTEPHRVRRFYARRALRLLPAVAVLLAVAAVVALLGGVGVTRTANTLVVVLTYTTNWATLHGVSVLPQLTHLWSLAVEEQFYLVWPALIWGALALGARRRTLVALTLGLAAAAAVWRLVEWETTGLGVQLYFRSDTRADALLVGAALALVPPGRVLAVPRQARLAAAAGGAVVLAACMQLLDLQSAWLYRGGFLVVAVASGALIVAALQQDTRLSRALAAPPLVAVGIGSYALYLWHFPIFLLIRDHLGAVPWPGRVLIGVGAAALATWASRRFVEAPALALRPRGPAARPG